MQIMSRNIFILLYHK